MSDEWVLPKGHIEPGEGTIDAALREVREESGAHGTRPKLVGIAEYTARGREIVCAFYAMDLGKLSDPEEPRDRAWLTLKEVRRAMPFPETLALVERAMDLARSQ